jgi:nucleoside 2-deoxyribosyltransferase
MRVYASQLRANGHTVTSRWLDETNPADTTMDANLPWAEMAERCLADISNADSVIAFTEPSPSPRSRGGRHVELGYALATLKYVMIVGPRENVFCHIVGVHVHDSWWQCFQAVCPEEKVQWSRL